MYCGQCGTQVRDDAQFCPCCGGIMEDSSQKDSSGVYTGRSTRVVQKRRKKWPWILLIVVLLAGFLTCVLCYVMLNRANQQEEDVFVEGKSSYTQLITAYLEEASDNDSEDILQLFFPNAQEYYQSSSSQSTLSLLSKADSFTAYYGARAVSAELSQAEFADLTELANSSLVSALVKTAQLTAINELYTVTATIGYEDGSSVQMQFEIVQCEYGCYLVSVSE